MEWLNDALNVGLGNLVIGIPETRAFFSWNVERRIQGSIQQWYPAQIVHKINLALTPMVVAQSLACDTSDDLSRLDRHVNWEIFSKKRSLMLAFTEKVHNFRILSESNPARSRAGITTI